MKWIDWFLCWLENKTSIFPDLYLEILAVLTTTLCLIFSLNYFFSFFFSFLLFSTLIYSFFLQEMWHNNISILEEHVFWKGTRYDYNLTIMKSSKPATDTIYPHIKFWWYRTMLNFYSPFLCRVLAAILKMADILKIWKTQNCSSNGDLSLCQILCLYHYPVRSYLH